jgi:hypothetical protein
MRFRDLKRGDEFDFVDDARPLLTSFSERYIKVDRNRYEYEYRGRRLTVRVGSINAVVYHVMPATDAR